MSIRTIREIGGQYEISTGVSKNDLERLSSNPKTKSIQIADPLTNKEIMLLETIIFSKRPDILFRVYGHYGKTCDLTFIKQLPSLRKISADCLMEAKGIESVTKLKNLDVLGLGIFNLDNFDFLEYIDPKIKELYLHQTKSKKPKIDIIGKFSNLEFLYLEGQQKGIEVIQHLHKLKKIILRSISTNNVDYLIGLQDLWSVDIKIGGIKNFDGLLTLPKLKYLELWQIRDLKDLSFVSELTTLQNLFIQSLKQVQRLPSFSKLTSLKRIYLENLKELTDLSTLKTAPALEEFIYVLAQNQEPENLIPVLENQSLKRIFCKFGSDKKNDRFDKLVTSYKKEQYDYSEFEYI
ncbi:hypothetical protein SNE25_18065 [Mucilaginibacter sabulilitoris]|uniref:Leucine-rich repeat domain-containing protein n=1 Tax=Mucilaginibacter sabulilitoris TaxID=1173583 RepID=A0ABZ0TDD5_9SPHI|nr:hypothetical protein [Mucilaginibacter sabulilitoris]WPU91226.1 hypothetical protein SNE25_18065 [Mucilaginibacter sabulilitoris]